MSDFSHRPGVREGFLVKRRLRLQPLDDPHARDAVAAVEALIGVDWTRWDPRKRVLTLAYDAANLQLDRILERLRERGGVLDEGWWSRFRLGWYRYSDQNVRDNAKLEPFCCDKVPPRK
jgi:hypothetical protein